MNELTQEIIVNGLVLVFGLIFSIAACIRLIKYRQKFETELYTIMYGEDETTDETTSNPEEGV